MRETTTDMKVGMSNYILKFYVGLITYLAQGTPDISSHDINLFAWDIPCPPKRTIFSISLTLKRYAIANIYDVALHFHVIV